MLVIYDVSRQKHLDALLLHLLDDLLGLLLGLLGVIGVGDGSLKNRRHECVPSIPPGETHLVSAQDLAVMRELAVNFALLVHLVEAALGICASLLRVVGVVHGTLCKKVRK